MVAEHECTIHYKGQKHILFSTHNKDYEKASYLFSLFDEDCDNADELIIDFANKHGDFMVFCYIGRVFEVKADAFMLSAIFQKQRVFDILSETNQHKLNQQYVYGLGMLLTPYQAIHNLEGEITMCEWCEA